MPNLTRWYGNSAFPGAVNVLSVRLPILRGAAGLETRAHLYALAAATPAALAPFGIDPDAIAARAFPLAPFTGHHGISRDST